MSRLVALCSTAALLVFAASASKAHAEDSGRTLAMTMTNDPVSNQIQVYDTSTQVLLQTLSTDGKGGVAGSARGVKQFKNEIVAAINNGSNTVALYTRDGDRLKFDKLVTTTSAPVSVDFGNDHMYVMHGATTGRFICASRQQRRVARWHDLAGTGWRRPSPERQHVTGWGDRPATSAGEPEERSGSGYRRRRHA